MNLCCRNFGLHDLSNRQAYTYIAHDTITFTINNTMSEFDSFITSEFNHEISEHDVTSRVSPNNRQKLCCAQKGNITYITMLRQITLRQQVKEICIFLQYSLEDLTVVCFVAVSDQVLPQISSTCHLHKCPKC